ncbi:MAG: alanine--tRNA ligase, partial [Elusimicrobiota bacterium]
MTLKAEEIRRLYLDFFKQKGHDVRPSAPLVPQDPTLLFNSAGMVPFKNYFLGKATDLTRAASCQLCLRTTDIERVGTTTRHLTFFEMLGNFSFGDYFKAEAILWAWEFLTRKDFLNLPKERLSVTIFKDDDEAMTLWNTTAPGTAVVRLGDDTNFWTMGPTGPCGPCSEIYWDRGVALGCGKATCAAGCDDCERYVEIWNLVFTGFDKQEDGSLRPLAKKNIDTGMGLERLTTVVEGQDSFSTTLFLSLLQATQDILSKPYQGNEKAMRIIADHCRASWFLLAEGLLPGNEGRSYILRRLIRRAARQAKLLDYHGPVLAKLAPAVKDIFASAYPEHCEKFDSVKIVLEEEEKNFERTLASGCDVLDQAIHKAKALGKTTITGAAAFELYDTYGFPVEMTNERLAEEGMGMPDMREFEVQRLRAKEVSKQSWKGSKMKMAVDYAGIKSKLGLMDVKFLGYDRLEAQTTVIAMLDLEGHPVKEAKAGSSVEVVLSETPFYPESGGQVGDKGTLSWPDGVAQVEDVQKPMNGLIVHMVIITSGTLAVASDVRAQVAKSVRFQTAKHHTATHLLHWALRKLLGTQVTQAGSRVADDKLRFDFTHPSTLKGKALDDIESLVQEQIAKDFKRERKLIGIDEAKKSGAVMLFNEKYGDKLFVVRFGESLEACGGTHVLSTGELGRFKIVKESSVAAGVRRIEAAAGGAIDSFEAAKTQSAPMTKKEPVAVQDIVEGGYLEATTPKGIPYRLRMLETAPIQHLRMAADKDRQGFQGLVFEGVKANGKLGFVIAGPRAQETAKALTAKFG